jgi:cbb3-type cytochrome oxidase maturation protein
MEILYLMVPLGLVLVGVGLWAFFWAVGSGQFGWSVLDDERKRKTSGDGTGDDSSRPAEQEPPRP